MSANVLKMIALITMTIDHVGLMLLPDYEWMRAVGRIAFPIFAFMIAEGCRYTRDRKRYVSQIAILGIGMQIVLFVVSGSQDITIPVEEIMLELVKLKEEGLIKNIGLSEVDADTLRRAHKIHPVNSVEVEYSLLNREIERELIMTAKELGVQVVVYGAVGHGVLTDKVINGGMSNPMMSKGILSPFNKKHNLQILTEFAEIAQAHGLTMSELALAWTQAKYDNILSLIGTTKSEHFLSSLKAMKVKLDEATVAEIEQIVSPETIKGHTMRKWIFENGVGKLV